MEVFIVCTHSFGATFFYPNLTTMTHVDRSGRGNLLLRLDFPWLKMDFPCMMLLTRGCIDAQICGATNVSASSLLG